MGMGLVSCLPMQLLQHVYGSKSNTRGPQVWCMFPFTRATHFGYLFLNHSRGFIPSTSMGEWWVQDPIPIFWSFPPKGEWNHKWNCRGQPPSPIPFSNGSGCGLRVHRQIWRLLGMQTMPHQQAWLGVWIPLKTNPSR